jgi:hypothetical protein
MLRTLLMLTLMTAPAYAQGAYYSDDMPVTSIHPVDGGYVISEGTRSAVLCVPYDAKWHICDERKDYFVHFEKHGDELWISNPSAPEGEFDKFQFVQ